MVKPKHRGKKLPYLRISAGPLRGQYVHRLIMEAKLGRPLTEEETVDHEDGNTLNDAPSNLVGPISWEEHGRITQRRQRERRIAAQAAKEERRKNQRRKDDEVPF